jgi:hypothetical protein
MISAVRKWAQPLHLRDWLVLGAGAGAVVGSIGLGVARDLSWVFVIVFGAGYLWLIERIHTRARARSVDPRQARISSLATAYVTFTLLVLGLAMTWSAVLQLQTGAAGLWPLVLFGIGSVLVVLGLVASIAVMRKKWR